MATNRSSFEKLQRARAKKAKADAKRRKRQGLEPEPGDTYLPSGDDTGEDPGHGGLAVGDDLPADVLLQMVSKLHEDFEAERIDFDTFEERKQELMARLTVE